MTRGDKATQPKTIQHTLGRERAIQKNKTKQNKTTQDKTIPYKNKPYHTRPDEIRQDMRIQDENGNIRPDTAI